MQNRERERKTAERPRKNKTKKREHYRRKKKRKGYIQGEEMSAGVRYSKIGDGGVGGGVS